MFLYPFLKTVTSLSTLLDIKAETTDINWHKGWQQQTSSQGLSLKSRNLSIEKAQHSNQFSFMRHNKRLISVRMEQGTQKFFVFKKSLFSQKATVQIKNPSFHWICLYFLIHKASSESRKNFSMVVATHIRTVKSLLS